MTTRKMNITETELEQILSGSRFTSSRHKEQLRERLFGSGAGRSGAFFEALSEADLELAAGGRADPAGRTKKQDAETTDDEWKKKMERSW